LGKTIIPVTPECCSPKLPVQPVQPVQNESKPTSTCNSMVSGGYPKKTLLPPTTKGFTPTGMMPKSEEPSYKKDSGPVKYTGFKKTKVSSKKKPIDAIMREEKVNQSKNS